MVAQLGEDGFLSESMGKREGWNRAMLDVFGMPVYMLHATVYPNALKCTRCDPNTSMLLRPAVQRAAHSTSAELASHLLSVPSEPPRSNFAPHPAPP